MQKTSERDSSFDFIRICSILAVIVIHSIATAVLVRPTASPSWMVANIIDSFMRWSVPVFVMISGSLLIKNSSFLKSKLFLRRRMPHIVVAILVWPFIYIAWSYFVDGVRPNLDVILGGYISGMPAPGHLYFLFIIAGVYCFAPIISLYAMSVSKRRFFTATLLVLVVTATWHLITYLVPGYNQRPNFLTQGLPYIGYFMLGYVLKDVKVKKSWLPFLVFFTSGLVLSVVTYIMTINLGLGQGLTFYAFPSILVMVMSASAYLCGIILYDKIMLLFSGENIEKANKILKQMAEATFGVYLIHLIFLGISVKLFNVQLVSLSGALLALTSTAIMSYVACLIIIRIPYLRTLIK